MIYGKSESLQLFEDRRIRTAWNEEEEKWYFSIIDIISVLSDNTDYQTARKYWNKLKQGLSEEGNESATNGKKYLTDVADTEQLFRLIQSVPSKKAEPVKQWIARTAAERIDQLMDPELSIKQAMADYKRMGYSDNWINQHLKSIEIRKDLTDEWKKRGLKEVPQFATLTDIIYKAWSDMSAKEYKRFKGLTKENLRDNMTNKELVLMLAEISTKEISESREPDTFEGHMQQECPLLEGQSPLYYCHLHLEFFRQSVRFRSSQLFRWP